MSAVSRILVNMVVPMDLVSVDVVDVEALVVVEDGAAWIEALGSGPEPPLMLVSSTAAPPVIAPLLRPARREKQACACLRT